MYSCGIMGQPCAPQRCLEDPAIETKDSPANKRLHDVIMMARKSWTLKARSLPSSDWRQELTATQ